MTFAPSWRIHARSVLLLGLLAAFQSPGETIASDALVTMTASADTFAFSPDSVVAHLGQQETLDLRSIAGVHGIASPELGIDATLIRPGLPMTVTFTPRALGSYVVHCSNVCGIGHKGMAFKVTVLP